jgi:HEAT repeat protein
MGIRRRASWTALVALAALPAAAHADAGPAFGSVRADVDGDGTRDEVALDAAGVVLRPGGARPEVRFSAAMTRGTVTAGRGWIAIEATTASGIEGIGLRYRGGALAAVWRGPVGPVGEDGEYRTALTAIDGALVRHQSRADIRRCDGKPALLFPESWDDGKRGFRAALPRIDVDPGAPVVQATALPTRDLPAPPRPAAFTARAASSDGRATDAGSLIAPRELDDGDIAAAWRENKGGDGRGEFLTYRAAVRGERARALWFARATDAAANQPVRLAVVGAERAYWIDLPADGGAVYRAELPEPIADCVTIVIAKVKPGKGARAGGGTTAIGELVVLGDADLAQGGGMAALVATVAAGGAGEAGATDLLLRNGAPAAQALVDALDGTNGATALADKTARRRVLRALIRTRSPIGAAAIAAAIGGELAGPDLDDASRALAALGPSAVPALAAVAADAAAPAPARVATIRALGGIAGAPARDALVAAAGTGTRDVRFAVTHALGVRPVRELLEVPAAATEAAQADVLRGIGLAAAHTATPAGDRADAVRALGAGLTAATDYERRYRAIQGLAGLGDAAALRGMTAALGALPAGGETSALRQVAALGLGRNADAEAAAILIALAADADPGVRLRAIAALAERPALIGGDAADVAAADPVLIGALAGDRWPELRRAAATSLGARCDRAEPAAALVKAVDGDAELEVRGDALAALVACKATGIATKLIAVATDGKAPLPLRQRAVLLIRALDDPRMIEPAVELFERFRAGAFDSEESLALATRAAAVLGGLGGPRAAAALEDALEDEALPDLVAAAASGLAAMGPGCPRSAAARLRELATSDNATIAASARRAAAVCGK